MENVIKEASRLLEENRQEWEPRYKKYVEAITTAQSKSDMNLPFKLPTNVRVYKTISSVDKLEYDLRYAGQSIGSMTFEDGKIMLHIKKMNKWVGATINSDIDCEWRSNEASNFRSYFKNCDGTSLTSSPERHIEELLLNDMSQSNASYLIRPITLLEGYFQMPTPFAASSAVPQYTGCKGGGIDILASVGKGKGTKLCVIELKDENKKNEPQPHAMKQAAIYATFIAYLLRSNVGEAWWKAFGYESSICNKPISIDVLTLMPHSQECTEELIGDFNVPGLNNVTLNCLSMYYELLDGNQFRFSSDNYEKIIRK